MDRILKVDRKGRIQIPKEVRERLGIKGRVKGRTNGTGLIIEPIPNLLDKLASQVKFNFGSVEVALPALRRAAAEQLLREIR